MAFDKNSKNSDYAEQYRRHVVKGNTSVISSTITVKQKPVVVPTVKVPENIPSLKRESKPKQVKLFKGFSHLVYALSESKLSDDICRNGKSLSLMTKDLLNIWDSVHAYKHVKSTLFDMMTRISDTELENKNKFLFMVFKTAPIHVENINANTLYSTDTVSTLDNVKNLAYKGDISSLTGVIEIEKVFSRKCLANHIVTTSSSVKDIPSVSYCFNIRVLHGNINGYSVTSFLKSIGFKASVDKSDLTYLKNPYLDSLLWYGEHKKQLASLSLKNNEEMTMPRIVHPKRSVFSRKTRKAVLR